MYLVHSGYNASAFQDLLEILHRRVRNADALRQPLLLALLHPLPHLDHPPRVLERRVDQEQVHILCLKLREALHERVAHGLARGKRRELRGEEQRRTWDAGLRDGLADRRLVPVELRGVEMRDAGAQRLRDRRGRVLSKVRGAGADCEPRDGGAVVQFE